MKEIVCETSTLKKEGVNILMSGNRAKHRERHRDGLGGGHKRNKLAMEQCFPNLSCDSKQGNEV